MTVSKQINYLNIFFLFVSFNNMCFSFFFRNSQNDDNNEEELSDDYLSDYNEDIDWDNDPFPGFCMSCKELCDGIYICVRCFNVCHLKCSTRITEGIGKTVIYSICS